ncbi:MAG: aminotransferase class V-fold PLP-dependent enzyme [Gemmatimonadaceae bacterium]
MLAQSLVQQAPAQERRDEYFSYLRRTEFARLDRNDLAYLDYTGSALYAERQIRAYADLLRKGVFGNPHSESAPSKASTTLIEEAKLQLLDFLGASPEDYVVSFTANTSAAIKLVAESFPFGEDGCLVLSSDNHNSMNGIREYATHEGACVEYLPLDDDLRLADPLTHLRKHARKRSKLFAYPAQSNFSGVKHSLDLVRSARAMGYTVLLDAAAFAPTNKIDLCVTPADFIALSMYKIFGLPTGVGALVARRDALRELHRPWFAGGTVEYASVQNRDHLLRGTEAAFEDGTPSFLDIGALAEGFAVLDEVQIERLNEYVSSLTSALLDRLQSLHRGDGSTAVKIYGPLNLDRRGATIAFNVLDKKGRTIPYWIVEAVAREAGVAVRGGCFCNPGASEKAFGFRADDARRCTEKISANEFTVARFAECLGPTVPVGAVRASIGMAANLDDIDRLIEVVDSFS